MVMVEGNDDEFIFPLPYLLKKFTNVKYHHNSCNSNF